MNRLVLLAAAAAAAAAAGWWWMTRKKSLSQDELVALLEPRVHDKPGHHVRELIGPAAAAALETVPSDFTDESAPDDDKAATTRWALLILAVADRESWGGYAPGYFPKGDPMGWGDHSAAFGFWQFDKHVKSNWAWIQTEPGVDAQAQRAGEQLAERWGRFHNEQLTAAAYNASEDRLETQLGAGASVDELDATTTGGDYGAFVVGRVNAWRVS